MQFFTALFLAALTSAAIAQPGTQVKRADADNGPIFVEPLDVFPSDPTITEAPVVDANAVRVNDVDYESTSSCTPASICFDGITCGMRYGGCYDKNFCAGSTSFPIPTCTDDPSAGLTQNFQKRAEAAAVVAAAA